MNKMNSHEMQAFIFIKEVMSEYIGGYENQLMNSPEDSEDYKQAERFLNMGHDKLVEVIYSDVIASCDKGMAKHARFAGKEFMTKKISDRLTKWGY